MVLSYRQVKLGLERLRAFLTGSDDAEKYDLRDLVDVLAGLGYRIGELLALDWPRIDDKEGRSRSRAP